MPFEISSYRKEISCDLLSLFTLLIEGLNMFEHVDFLYGKYIELIKANPVAGTIISAYGLGVLTFLLKGIPSRLFTFMKDQCTTTLVMTNSEIGSNYETFVSFMEWFNQSRWARLSRSFMVDGRYWSMRGRHSFTPENTLGVGLGTHVFFYKGRLCWMERSMLGNGQQAYKIHYQITIRMLGRNQKRLREMFSDFRWKASEDEIGIYRYGENGWTKLCDSTKRDLDTVIVDPTIKEHICRTIEQFEKDRDWYLSRGLAWKKTIMLEGPPGSGKTSLIKALASHYSYNLCTLNLNYTTDMSLEHALANTPNRSFIVMEDFDDTASGFKRHNLPLNDVGNLTTDGDEVPITSRPRANIKNTDDSLTASKISFLSLSGLLNSLDGLVSLDGKIIIMTTNIPDSLDFALLRKGRIDERYHLGPLRDLEVRSYIEMMFPGHRVSASVVFKDIMGCDLQALYFEHRDNVDAFVDAIPRSNGISDIHYPTVVPFPSETKCQTSTQSA